MSQFVGKCWMVVLFLCLLPSCDHKELCFDHAHMVDLDIRFDWSEAPDADPRTMVVQFFRMDGSYYTSRELPRAAGGKVRVEADEYMLLFHNGEMEAVGEGGNTCDSFWLYTKPQSILDPMGRGGLATLPPEATAGEPVRGIPEVVWGGRHAYLNVQRGVEGQSVTLKPAEVTTWYTIEVCNVENMDPMLDVSGALSGMCEGWRLKEDVSAGISVTMPFELERRYDEKKLVARFPTFGHCPVSVGKHTFFIYTSRQTYYDFDVTDKIHDGNGGMDESKEIHIMIDDGLKLPPATGGMTPSIDGWDDVVNNDINMN